MITFPTSGRWKVAHALDFFADLVRTRGLDFSRPGYIRLAKKPVVLFTQQTDSDFNTVMAITPISSGVSASYYTITTGHMFYWDGTDNDFVQTTASGEPSFDAGSDAVSYLGLLTASGGSTVKSYSGGAGGSWTSRITGLDSDNPHPMCVHEYRNTLCVADGNVVTQTLSTSYSDDSANKLTIPVEYVITGLRFRAGNVYIATRNISSGDAKLFVWNGAGTSAQAAFGCGADWIYSQAEYQSSIVILTSAGQLRRFNGGGFDELAHFPVYDTPYSWGSNAGLSNSTGRCANRGMAVIGDKLFLNIDGRINSDENDYPGRFIPEQPSGLWVFDPNVGLYHRAGYGYARFRAPSFTFGSSNFVVADHALVTGDPVYIKTVSGLEGLTASQLCYAIVDSTSSFRLAQSKAEALAGYALTITGAKSTDTILIDDYHSLGSTLSQTFPGAICPFITDNPPSFFGSELLYSGDVSAADGSSISAIMSLGAGRAAGSFVMTPIPAAAITDVFQKLVQTIGGMDLDAEAIIVKYRRAPRYGFPTRARRNASDTSYFASWTTPSTFTIDTTKKDFRGAQVGDEVEIVEGAAAGYSAHITAINDSTNIFTVTVDETLPVSNGDKSEVIVDNWIKGKTFTSDSEGNIQHYAESVLDGVKDSAVQFKVELRGFDVSVRRIMSESAPNKQI